MLGLKFSVAIFDLDQTLWDGIQTKKLYPDALNILTTLEQQKIPMYICSYNSDPKLICERLGIDKFFSDFLYARTKKKSQMIREIMSRHNTLSLTQFAFFDDQYTNITDVKLNNHIQAVTIGSNGIKWSDLPKKEYYGINARSCRRAYLISYDINSLASYDCYL